MEKKDRSSNIELYRILVMLLIVSHHYVVNSGLANLLSLDPLSGNSIFYLLFGAWGKTGINCFVMITGYFMCQTSITLRKFLKLFLEVLTYSIVINVLFLLFGYSPLGVGRTLLSIIPLRNIGNGFTSAFLLFYLCIPFLNIFLKGITKRQHQAVIGLLLFIYTIHTAIPGILSVTMNYVSWFVTLYMIASYLRLYPIREADKTFWGMATLLSWGTSVLSVIALNWIQVKIGRNPDIGFSYIFISDSNTILALLNGITSFMWFHSMNLQYNKLINTISACTFGVFLIHTCSDTMRQWLWKDTIDCIGHYDTPYYWLYAIGCVLAIYVICTIIDYIRIKTIETPLLNATEKACYWVEAKLKENN